MDWQEKFFLVAILVLFVAIDAAQANTMVSGTVFCDQCKDGERSLFDYPIYGVKVQVACSDSNGQITMSWEETTNWFGNYAIGFDGTPDLSGCYAQISSSTGSGCVVSAGPAQSLRLVFRMFDMGMYVVDSLLTQPAQPMSFCPKSSNPVPAPVTLVNPLPKPVTPASPPPFRLPPNASIAATATTALVASNAANALLGSYSMPTSNTDTTRAQMLLEGSEPEHKGSRYFWTGGG
ncbi:unnamed protein product [Malus baccata var. baccata]